MSVTAVPLRPIQKGTLTKLWIGVAIVLLAACVFAWFSTARAVAINGGPEAFMTWNGSRSGVTTTDTGLQYEILEAGDGDGSPSLGDAALVNYEGRLIDGSIFDANDRASFQVGAVIEGWNEALQLMDRGARYRIWLPPELGYGSTPPPESTIPADAVLEFDVELVDFISQEEAMRRMQIEQMMQGGGQGVPPEGGQ
ncbi:MAG: FKBP-type peptidyl-prolyl cis-trans isomerase [Sphingomonadaceae bacterium]|nr:FKBP-type peptidyl-prolyl cis-trans isomerase [Sphingomonadaceae bacterium]